MTETQLIEGKINAEQSLQEVWAGFAADLRRAGAPEEQITAMQTTFYMGAAQVFAAVDYAAKSDIKTLGHIMRRLFFEIDTQIKRDHELSLWETKGSA